MAARRLIAILLVLLFLSSLAAALAPVQQTGKSVSTSTTETSTSETTPSPPTLPAIGGSEAPALINQSIDAGLKKAPVIRAGVGDQLQLRVTSKTAGTVELVKIGPTEDVGPEQPAFFDVLLRDEGTYPVRLLGTDREIATIKVTAARAEAPPAR